MQHVGSLLYRDEQTFCEIKRLSFRGRFSRYGYGDSRPEAITRCAVGKVRIIPEIRTLCKSRTPAIASLIDEMIPFELPQWKRRWSDLPYCEQITSKLQLN